MGMETLVLGFSLLITVVLIAVASLGESFEGAPAHAEATCKTEAHS